MTHATAAAPHLRLNALCPYFTRFPLDLPARHRRLRPADVISIALSPEKQEQQNVRKLKGMNDEDWRALVDAVAEEGNTTDLG